MVWYVLVGSASTGHLQHGPIAARKTTLRLWRQVAGTVSCCWWGLLSMQQNGLRSVVGRRESATAYKAHNGTRVHAVAHQRCLQGSLCLTERRDSCCWMNDGRCCWPVLAGLLRSPALQLLLLIEATAAVAAADVPNAHALRQAKLQVQAKQRLLVPAAAAMLQSEVASDEFTRLLCVQA